MHYTVTTGTNLTAINVRTGNMTQIHKRTGPSFLTQFFPRQPQPLPRLHSEFPSTRPQDLSKRNKVMKASTAPYLSGR